MDSFAPEFCPVQSDPPVLTLDSPLTLNVSISSAASSFGPYAQAIAALLVGLAVAYVAYQQWRTAATKLRFDVFEERLRIFRLCRDFITELGVSGSVDEERRREVAAAALEVRFLFNPDIAHWVANLSSAGKSPPASPMTEADSESARKWSVATGTQLSNAFEPFMRLDKLFWSRRGRGWLSKFPSWPFDPQPQAGPTEPSA